MLLAQPGCFSPDIPAEIYTPKGNQLVQIEKRIEATPSIDLFRYQMHSPVKPSEF